MRAQGGVYGLLGWVGGMGVFTPFVVKTTFGCWTICFLQFGHILESGKAPRNFPHPEGGIIIFFWSRVGGHVFFTHFFLNPFFFLPKKHYTSSRPIVFIFQEGGGLYSFYNLRVGAKKTNKVQICTSPIDKNFRGFSLAAEPGASLFFQKETNFCFIDLKIFELESLGRWSQIFGVFGCAFY